MEPYVWKRRPDGIHIINIGKTWQKIVLAARVIASIENPADVTVVSARPYGQRAVLKFAAHVGATAAAGRFTPGAFTNYNSRSFKEVHFSNQSILILAPSHHRHGSPNRPPSTTRRRQSFHPRHRSLRYRLPSPIRRYCHSHKQQVPSLRRSHLVAPCA